MYARRGQELDPPSGVDVPLDHARHDELVDLDSPLHASLGLDPEGTLRDHVSAKLPLEMNRAAKRQHAVELSPGDEDALPSLRASLPRVAHMPSRMIRAIRSSSPAL
jgi:hypothetical protein